MTPGQLALTAGLEDMHVDVVDPSPVVHPEFPSLIDLQVGDTGFVRSTVANKGGTITRLHGRISSHLNLLFR